MFYLKQFFHLFTSNGWKGFFFLILTLVFFAFSFSPKKWRQKLFSSEVKAKPSLSLITNASLSKASLEKKVLRVPFVKELSFLSKMELNQRIEQVSSELGTSAAFNFENKLGLTVFFKKELTSDKVVLFKQYLKRLAPGAEFYFSNYRTHKKKQSLFTQNSIVIALVGLTATWLLSSLLVLVPFRQKSFIIEKYQRKSWVGMKTMASGAFLFLVVNTLFYYLTKDAYFPALIVSSSLYLMLILFMLKMPKWKS